MTTTLTRQFVGAVSNDGRLTVEDRCGFTDHLKALAGKPVMVTVKRKRAQRSTPQNNYYWGVVVALVAEKCGYFQEEAHEALKYEFLRIEGDGPLPKVRSTTDLNTIEFEEFLDQVRMWAAMKLDLQIPLPNEVEFA